MSDDPFACFGSDSDSDSDENVPLHPSDDTERKLLIEEANKRLLDEEHQRANERVEDSFIANENSAVDEKEIELPPALQVPFDPPLYVGPMIVAREESTGGNRGYIATEDLQPGTLLLVEEPIAQWPEEQIGAELGLISVQAILTHENSRKIIQDMEGLHPTKKDVDRIVRNLMNVDDINENTTLCERIQVKEMIELMDLQHAGSEEMASTIKLAKATAIELDKIDILRLLLAMRYNGFGSGIYLHFAMFNHDDDCNCVKFVPEMEKRIDGNTLNGSDPGSNKKYSEVRTTKFVKRGTPLTLHYLDPRELSHASRRHHLWDQHRFDIGETMMRESDAHLIEMELVDGRIPNCEKDQQDHERITYLVETTLKELEQQCNEVKLAWSLNMATNKQATTSDGALVSFEQCKALEMAADEMIRASISKLGNKWHLLLIRCCRLHLDSAELLLRMGESLSPGLTSRQQIDAMLRFTKSCHLLLPLQVKYLGSCHPDVARTNYDLALSINGLLSRSPKSLFEFGIEALSNFGKCQRMEADCLREHRRIDAMFPRDVQEKLTKR